MKKNIWIIATVLVVGALIAVKLAGNKKIINERKKVTSGERVVVPVNTIKAQKDTLNDGLMKTGTALPWQEAAIAATASGTLQTVSFVLGSEVHKGSVIAQIDNRLLQLRLEAAQLQWQKLQKDYERYTTLLKGEATTEVNVRDIKFNLDNAENQINQIKKQIADNQIKAPISGQIVEKKLEAGEYVNMGSVVGRVVDVSKLKIDVKVGEQDAYKIKKGQKATITTDIYPGTSMNATIIFVSQEGDAAHNYQVQLELPNQTNKPLKAGTFVYVNFGTNSVTPVLQIPRSALVEGMKNPYVYLVENGKATVRKIVPGRESGSNIEVLEGLTEGEEVIVNGQVNLTSGTEVRIAQ